MLLTRVRPGSVLPSAAALLRSAALLTRVLLRFFGLLVLMSPELLLQESVMLVTVMSESVSLTLVLLESVWRRPVRRQVPDMLLVVMMLPGLVLSPI